MVDRNKTGRGIYPTSKGVQRRMVLMVNFIFLISLFCFVVATYDLVYDVEALFPLP